jgi:hypothetical protein
MRISIRRQRRTEAVVHTVPEGDVPGGSPGDVEGVGVFDEGVVAVGGGQ